MRYKDMLEQAKAKGLTSESLMWESIGEVEDMLCELKDKNPHKYWKFMRKQHGLIHHNHYDEEFAMWDVSKMKPLGEFWSKAQIEEATKNMSFPSETTIWDKYVAFNALKNDLNNVLTDEQILRAAHAFWFHDEDAPKGKIWLYMCKMHE